jgi:tetratricopeptide (TPR) repeat protein
MGIAHFALSAIDKALECFETALQSFPEEDASRAKIINNSGVAYYQKEDYGKALKCFTSALEIQRSWLEGPVRRESMVYDASVTLANMGNVYSRKGDYDLAYFVFEEACLMQSSTFRKDHDIVLTSLDNMARVHAKNGNEAEALRLFTTLSRSLEARFGADSEVCVETIGMKGMAHFKLLEFEEALECMKRVTVWQRKHLLPSHPSIQATKDAIRDIKRCLKGEEPMWV